jgi:hypothetical protein
MVKLLSIICFVRLDIDIQLIFKFMKKAFLLIALLYQQTAFAAPYIQVKSATSSNKRAGDLVSVGELIQTNKGGIATGDFLWGGVKSFSLFPSSSFKLNIFGNRAKGGHFSQFDLVGEALIEVQTTNPESEVKVCLKNRWGRTACATLKSTVRTAPTEEGAQVLGVVEGDVMVEGEKGSPVQVRSNEYTVLEKDGSLTPATTVIRRKGYSIELGRSKAIGVFKADPGWRFCDGSTVTTAAVGTDICVIDPLRGKP